MLFTIVFIIMVIYDFNHYLFLHNNKNRQLQGIVKTPCNIDGRVKLEEFQRIMNKILTMRNDPKAAASPSRKHLVVFKMAVDISTDSTAQEAYKHFCAEFTRDSRVGLSNLGGGSAQLYVIPPELQDSLSLFSSLNSIPVPAGCAVLYGLITSKDLGPDEYVHAGPDFQGGFTLEEPLYGMISC